MHQLSLRLVLQSNSWVVADRGHREGTRAPLRSEGVGPGVESLSDDLGTHNDEC